MDYSKLTLEDLKAHRPDLVEAISTDSASAAATAERERIQSVEQMAMPGHEDLIAALKFDGKTTGPEAAVRVLQAEKAANTQALADLETDAPAPVATAEPKAPQPKAKAQEDAALPIEERAKATWDDSPEVRAEFGSFDTYLAFRVAEDGGHVRYLRNGKKEEAA